MPWRPEASPKPLSWAEHSSAFGLKSTGKADHCFTRSGEADPERGGDAVESCTWLASVVALEGIMCQ